MATEHYFSTQPSGEFVAKPISVTLAGRAVELHTAGGVFSPGGLDLGTQVLLDHGAPPPLEGNLLDLGCGWGPIALTLALRSPQATVWAVDVNERALELTRRNAQTLGLNNVRAVSPDAVPDDIRFTAIWSNPPIRVGKSELHSMLESWLPRLIEGAESWLVVSRHLGSDSLQRWMETHFTGMLSVSRAVAYKGFRVLRARKGSGA
jgi:16S rRNA (guanine1207-N2)-methyltransferase